MARKVVIAGLVVLAMVISNPNRVRGLAQGYARTPVANPVNDDVNVYATLDASGGPVPSIAFRSRATGTPAVGSAFFGEPPQGIDWLISMVVLFPSPGGIMAADGVGLMEVSLFVTISGDTPQTIMAAYPLDGRVFAAVTELPYPVRIPALTQFRIVVSAANAGSTLAVPSSLWGCRLLGWAIPTGLPTSLLLLADDPKVAGMVPR